MCATAVAVVAAVPGACCGRCGGGFCVCWAVEKTWGSGEAQHPHEQERT